MYIHMNMSRSEMQIPLSTNVVLSMMVAHLLASITSVQSCRSPSHLVAFLSVATLSPQVVFLPLCLFTMFVLPQIVVPHILLRPILECILDPLVQLLVLFVYLNSNLFFFFKKILLQMFLTCVYFELQNVQIAFSHDTIFFPHSKNDNESMATLLPIVECLAI